jgi:diguanylate cyclase (GGDEF)-like protein/PAS domain S-box-containing protein
MANMHYLKDELYELIKTDQSIFDFIQESCLDGLWYWDLEHPEEEWMNPKFWSVLGYDHREMPHKTSAWQDIIHPEDLKLATENFIQHCENPEHPYDQTVRYTHKNGSTVWIRCRGLVIRDEHGKPLRMLGAHQEVTEIKSNELLLQKNIAQLRNAQQVHKIASWELDLKTNEVVWTEELFKMYGLDPALPPPPFHEQVKLFTSESWELLTSSIALTKEQGIPYELELTIIRKDGSHGLVQVLGEAVLGENKNIIGLRGVTQDISEKKILELEKEAVIKRLNYALDASGDGIWDYTPFNGISVFSKAWIEMLGYQVGELASLASEWSDRLHPDDAEWVFAAINKVTETPENGDTLSHEYRFRTKAGDYLWILNKVKVVERNEKGEASRVVGTHTNVTEQKKSEQEILNRKRLLKEMGAMASVGGWEVDLVNNEVFWTEETYRIYGLPTTYEPQLDEVINYYAPEARPIVQAAVQHAIASGEGWDLELPFIQADGTPIWVHALGNVEMVDNVPVRLIGAFHDITENVKQRKQIENINSRMALATDSGGIGIWEYNLLNDILIWDNQMYKIYGTSPQESEQAYSLWAKHLHPEDKAITEAKLNDAIAGNSQFDTEFRVIWNDGSIHYMCASARVTLNDEGQAVKLIGVNWDITHRRELADELAQQHELMQVTLQSIGDAVITTDAKGITQWLNPVAEKLTAWSLQEAIGTPISSVFNTIIEDTRIPTKNPVIRCLEQGKLVDSTEQQVLVSRKGDEYAIEDSASPILSKDGDLLGVVLVFRDVSEQRRLNKEMNYKATHDGLTGLINRVEFEARFRHLLGKAREGDLQHALMFIDLDQFKIVNDTCGHAIGDELLQQVARILGETVRDNDTLARLGGDEFCIILESCTIEQGQQVGQKICDILEDFRFIHGEHRFRIGSSIGLVAIDDSWDDISSILQAADTACYTAKDAGKNRVHTWFDSDAATQARHSEKQWTTRIEKALDEDRFVLHAQLLSKLNSQKSGIYAEVLVRMLNTDGSIIMPGEFLPAAERFQLAMRIDRWVLRNAIDWLKGRGANDPEIDMLFINLSGQSVGDRSFHMQACEIFSKAGKSICEKICVEITETAAITNIADASSFISQLNELGVTVALDDFGAGAASFGYLKHLNIDILKIDGQFIRDLLDDPLDDVAVRFFIEVARVMNLQTVAEFVDRSEVLSRIKELGIDYAQGFLLHKPEPIDSAIPMNDNNHVV